MPEAKEVRDTECTTARAKDWAGDWRLLLIVWGLPASLMIAAGLLDRTPQSMVWTASLVWMGTACLANARHCGRTHCLYTGPFFLLMALGVVGYAVGLIPLGENGWLWIGAVTAIGNALLWWGSERLLGRFSSSTAGGHGR